MEGKRRRVGYVCFLFFYLGKKEDRYWIGLVEDYLDQYDIEHQDGFTMPRQHRYHPKPTDLRYAAYCTKTAEVQDTCVLPITCRQSQKKPTVYLRGTNLRMYLQYLSTPTLIPNDKITLSLARHTYTYTHRLVQSSRSASNNRPTESGFGGLRSLEPE